VRGVYAKHDLAEGHVLDDDDVYLAIPLQRGQISCRELMRGEVLLKPVHRTKPIMIDSIDSPYSSIPSLRELIYSRGWSPPPPTRGEALPSRCGSSRRR
jgi:hypothetical protein